MREKNSKDNQRFLSVIIVAVLLLLTTIAYGCVFSSNDDGMLRAIASGAYTGKPDAHLIYMLYPIGLIFKSFYSLIPALSWYDLLLTLMHITCFYLLIERGFSLLDRRRDKLLALLVLTLLWLAVDFKYLVLHQYTILAGFIMATALFYLATLKSDGKKDIVIIIVLLTLALWLRKEVFFMGLPLLGLVLLALIVSHRTTARLWLTLIITMAFITASSLCIDAMAYSSDEWKAYKSFNQARTQVYDYFKFPEYQTYEDFYTSQNIDQSSYEVLAHYLDVSLPLDMTDEKLTAVATKYDQIMEEWKQFYSVPKKIIKDTGLSIIHNEVQPLGLIMFVSCLLVFLLYMKSNIWISFMALAAYGYRLVFTAYFVSKGRFPERVSYGLYMMITCIMAGFILGFFKARKEDKGKIVKIFAVCSVFLLFTAAVFSMAGTYKVKTQTMDKAQELSAIYTYCSMHPENVYFVNTYSIAPLTEEMFSYAKLPQNCIIMGNWTSHSPLEKARLEVAGVESFQNDLLLNNKVFLLVKAQLGSEWIENFYSTLGYKISVSENSTITANNNEQYFVVDISKASD